MASVTHRSNSRYSCIRAINLLRYGSRSGSLTVAVSIAMPGDFAPAMRTDCVPPSHPSFLTLRLPEGQPMSTAQKTAVRFIRLTDLRPLRARILELQFGEVPRVIIFTEDNETNEGFQPLRRSKES